MIRDVMRCFRDFKSDHFGESIVLYGDCVVI